MIGELGPSEIERVLRDNIVGRIGCHGLGRTYVVPVTYVYDGKYVYAHSREGMKLHIMRENPHVCFEVDRMDDFANWTSVIAWGTFEQLRPGEARDRALNVLIDGIAPHLRGSPPGETMHPHDGMDASVIYRIELESKSGRFERRL